MVMDDGARFAAQGAEFSTVRLPSEFPSFRALTLSGHEAPNPVTARSTNLAHQVSLTGLPPGIPLTQR